MSSCQLGKANFFQLVCQLSPLALFGEVYRDLIKLRVLRANPALISGFDARFPNQNQYVHKPSISRNGQF